ncbi:MFS transporter, partial [Paenibacillus sepulcri]|nr:MFS transporter [Paenibacillus sepulcri]
GHTGSGGPVTPIERAWLSSYARRNANSIFGTQALLCYLGMGLGAVISSLPPLWRHLLPGAFGYRPLFALIFLFTAGSVCVIAKIAGGKRKTPQVKADAHTDPGKIKDSAPAQAAKSPQGKLPALLVVAALVLGAAIPLWNRLLPVVSLYIPVLVFVLFISAAVFRITGGKPKALLMNDANDVMPPSSPEMTKLAMEKQQELLNLINMVNAIAVTLSSTMTSYWLSAKFGVSSGMIGLVMAASYMLTGVFSLVSIHAAKRFGSVKTIVCMQLAGIVFVLALPWSPWFWLTAVLNIGCIAFNLGTRGNRSVVMVETIRRRKRSWPSRAASLLLRTGTVLWPGVFGKLIEEGQFMLPLYIAGFLQFGSTLWYGKTHQIPRSAAPATGRTEEFRNQKR